MSEFSHLIYKVYYNYWFSHQKATKLEKVDVTLTLTTSDFKSSDIVNYTFENFNCIQDPEKGIEEYIKKDIGTYEKSNVKKIVIPKKLIDLVRSEIIKDPNISEYVIKLPKDVAFNTHPLVYFYALKEAVKSIKTEYENRKKLETEVGLIELNIDKTIKVAIDSSASSTQKDYIILEDCKAEEFLHKGFDALKELYTILYSEKQ